MAAVQLDETAVLCAAGESTAEGQVRESLPAMAGRLRRAAGPSGRADAGHSG